jgi:hypothetical protein
MSSLLKSAVACLALALAPSIVASQEAKEKSGHDMDASHMKSAWKEMDSFHTLLAATYHPASNKKDVAPLRAKANDLAAAARAWSTSNPPATCNTSEVKSRVATIATDALGIANEVLASATSASLIDSINDLHTKFEKVEKACGGHSMKHDQ